MRRLFAAVSRIAICAWVLACTTPTESPRDLGPVPDGSLMTDATGYVAQLIIGSERPTQYQFTVISRFENPSAAPVYLARCSPDSPHPMYSIGTADGSAVQSAYDPAWACVGHDKQFEILPGAARVDTFVVQGPTEFDENTQQAIGVTTGVFRFFLSVASARGDGAPAAAGVSGTSNPFIVRTSQ